MLTIVNFNYVMEKRGWTRGRFEQQGLFQENQQAGTYNNPKLYPKQCSIHTRARFYNKRLWAFQWSPFLHM
jgi:hypothetical protein